ncbi:hypothetical protein ABZ234_12825 [Nocardiopsis sp. NPDC006198]|uniref:hypothetical protein n=1 Tax=Nocardiopsis sp. NPDC006198 TaxID=3154472 RepID=UPI0033AA9011
MPTTFHRSRTLLAAGAIAVTAVLGLAACENTAGAEGDSVDSEEMTDGPADDDMSEEMSDDMSEEMTEESGEDDMSEDPMGDDMSEEPMDEGMDDEG